MRQAFAPAVTECYISAAIKYICFPSGQFIELSAKGGPARPQMSPVEAGRWRGSSRVHLVPIGGGQEFPPGLMDSREGAQVAHGEKPRGCSQQTVLLERN